MSALHVRGIMSEVREDVSVFVIRCDEGNYTIVSGTDAADFLVTPQGRIIDVDYNDADHRQLLDEVQEHLEIVLR